jgi:hypothetical protein
MFFPSSPVVIGLHALVAASGAVPTIDVAKTCRAAEKAIIEIMKEARAANFEGCMKQEMAARDSLLKGWAAFPAPDKARCVNPSRYMPSYVEWLSCLETAKAVRDISR